MHAVLSARKEQVKGKQVVVKGKFVFTTTEIYDGIAAAEAETEMRHNTRGRTIRKRKARPVVDTEMAEDEDDALEVEMEAETPDIQDCIEVA